MFGRVDNKSEESVDFSFYGFVKIFAFLKLLKTKDKLICPLCRVTSGRMIKSQEQDEFIAVRVQDPRVQNEGSWNSYVDFKIFLHTNSKAFTAKTSCVRRRYSEFVWLKKKLQKNTGLVPVPDLPKKSLFSFINDDFIERRRKGLQSFLDKVLHMTVCLSDSQLHLFLQTQLPVKHIEDCVQGHTPYTVTEAILNYASSNLGWVQEEGENYEFSQELWPTPVSYESVESPAPHLPSLQSPGATFTGPPNERTDISDSESRLSDADETAHDLKQVIGHEQLPQEGESCIKLVVEVHPNLVGSIETEEEGENIGSNKVTKDLQMHDCEYPAPQIDEPRQGDTSNEEDLDRETSVGEDVVDITSVDGVIEERTLDDINEAKKGDQDDGLEQESTVRQTPKKDLYEEDPRVRIHNNEVTLDLSAVKEDNAEHHTEKVLESTATTVDVTLRDACEENMPDTKDHDKAEITEDHMVQENGVSDEDYSEDTAVQEEDINANEEHTGEVNKLNAKCHQPGSGILIHGGIEEAVSTQTTPVTETVSNLDANTADVNTLVLQAIEIESMQCQEMDSHIIITTHKPDRLDP